MSTFNLLIVDDAPHMREVVKFTLEELNGNIFQAENGKEGYDILCKNNIDLVITDLHMPIMSGMELLRKIREMEKQQPSVFILSAYCEVSMDEIFDRGAERIFAKPFSPLDLFNECKAVLEKEEFKFKTPKQNTLFQVEYKNLSTSDKHKEEGHVVLGRNGVFIPSHVPLKFKRGSLLDFKLRFKDTSHPMEFTGCVEWVRNSDKEDLHPGMGIRFVDIAPELLKNLRLKTQAEKIQASIPLGRKS